MPSAIVQTTREMYSHPPGGQSIFLAKQSIKFGRGDNSFSGQPKLQGTQKEKYNIIKENKTLLVVSPTEIKIYKFSDAEFKMGVFKKLSELQEPKCQHKKSGK